METQNSSGLLRNEILTQSKSEAESILDQAKKEYDRQINQAKKEADREQEQLLKNGQVQASGIRKKILSNVKLEVKKQQLDTREKVIVQIFQILTDRLIGYRDHSDYLQFLIESIVEAAVALPGDRIQLCVGEKEKQLLETKTLHSIEKQIMDRSKRKVTLNITEDFIDEGGVLAFTADKRMRFDNRFSAQLHRMEDEMRLMIVREVFEQEKQS
jgi:V/A-type H+-transporting ATPase subunit E